MQKVVLDIETVGLKCGFHEITEVSILDCQTLEQKTWLIKVKYPDRASKEALMITNKNIKELCARPDTIEKVIPEIESFLNKISDNNPDDLCCIGHNVSFDRRFLENAFEVANKTFPANYWLCTMEMSKKFSKNILKITEKMSFALSNMCKVASIETPPDMHTSAVDVLATHKLYTYMKTRGMSDSEFIKLSPTILNTIGIKKVSKTVVTNKKTKNNDIELLNDISVGNNVESNEIAEADLYQIEEEYDNDDY